MPAAAAASRKLLDRIARDASTVLAASNAVAFRERLAERRTGRGCRRCPFKKLSNY
jgi:hypothetical protein